MGIPTQPNQQDVPFTGEIKPPQIEWVKNDPKTTKHLPLPNSSWLQSVSYDSASLRMTLTTKDGASWQHSQVYPAQFTEMQLHPSKGSYYAKNIKGQHPITHIKKNPRLSDFPRETKTHGPKNRFERTDGRYSKTRYA